MFGSILNTKTVTGNGEATIEVIPDFVTIYFNAETKADTADKAKDENAEIVDELITNLVKQGFERKDIQTQNFNIYPDYKWVNNQRVENGYRATHSIKLQMPTEESDEIGSAIDAGVDAGATISYINFELSQDSQNRYKAQAIESAAQDARIKAEALARGLGKELGSLVSVSDSNFGYSPWRIYEIAEDSTTGAEEAKQATTDIQPGEQEISARVTAVFKFK